MTVLKVDKGANRFLCVEHKRWTTVAPGDLDGVRPGDIVKVTRHGPQPVHITIVRSAADELTSPEH